VKESKCDFRKKTGGFVFLLGIERERDELRPLLPAAGRGTRTFSSSASSPEERNRTETKGALRFHERGEWPFHNDLGGEIS